MKTDYDKELRAEREKLNQLVDDALRNGTPISQTYDIMKQSNKVNQIILKIKATADNYL